MNNKKKVKENRYVKNVFSFIFIVRKKTNKR